MPQTNAIHYRTDWIPLSFSLWQPIFPISPTRLYTRHILINIYIYIRLDFVARRNVCKLLLLSEIFTTSAPPLRVRSPAVPALYGSRSVAGNSLYNDSVFIERFSKKKKKYRKTERDKLVVQTNNSNNNCNVGRGVVFYCVSCIIYIYIILLLYS